jgi:GTP-binding protein
MRKPIVALVGRPNVGKSTFFNKVSGKKISIVEDRPGITRDRIYTDAEWRNKVFTMIDTGGIEMDSTDEMWMHIKKQAEIAIETADVIVFFVDAKTGLNASDIDVADKLRRSKKPIVLAVNKIDNYSPDKLFEFYSLGIGEPFAISAEQSQGLGDLLDEVVANFEGGDVDDSEYIKIAVVGKPNAGKSSLVNKILGFDRTIVSDIAGTTRDAIDTPFELDGKKYMLIDTAGIRRKRSVEDNVEYYSVIRAIGAIKRADVCIAVVDSEEGLTEQDVKICGLIHEEGKPSIIVMNKWDKVEKDTNTINKFEKKLSEDLKFMDYFRSVYISAKTGQRVDKVISIANEVFEKANYRVTTGTLNDVISDAIRMQEPPSNRNGKRLKLYYSSQVSVCPPTFVIFVNDETIMHFSYKRYLENCIRKSFDFSGTPIRLFIREKKNEGD